MPGTRPSVAPRRTSGRAAFFIVCALVALVVIVYFNFRPKADPIALESIPPGPTRDLFVAKCSRCHQLERVLSARKTAEDWSLCTYRMQIEDLLWISYLDRQTITQFLTSIQSLSSD